MSVILTREILDQLSHNYGDAYYILESDVFEQNYIELMECFKKYYQKFNIAYSYKTNYIPKLARIVNKLGGYAEVVSPMEMEIAIKSGIDFSRIIWNGPIKDKQCVQELLIRGGTVNLDSVYEIETIRRISDAYPDRKLNVGIRCNYDVGDGVVSRFGFDVDGTDFDSVLSFISSMPSIHLISLQAHFAKRAPEYWESRAAGMIRVYERVVNQYHLQPERLDIGGGIYGKMPESLRTQIGVSYVTYNDYASRAAQVFKEHFSETDSAPFLFIEPGTALAGNCMRFVTKVATIKDVRGKVFATVTGSQKNISMNGLNPPMTIVNGGGNRKEVCDADIVGYTCIEGDVLQKNYTGSLGVGDYLIFENCGSYSIVMKPPFIFPNVPILDLSSGTVEEIKAAETFDDLFHTFQF